MLFLLKLNNSNIDSAGFISVTFVLFLESFLHHLHLDIHLAKSELQPILPVSPHVIATSCLGTFLSLCVQCILHLLAWLPIRMCHQVYLSSASSAGGPTFILSCRSCPKKTAHNNYTSTVQCNLNIYIYIYIHTDFSCDVSFRSIASCHSTSRFLQHLTFTNRSNASTFDCSAKPNLMQKLKLKS